MITTNETQQNAVATKPSNEGKRSYVPHVDVVETGNVFTIRVDLPGTRADLVRVDVDDKTLTIDAEVAERQPAGTKYLVREYGVGRFHREFRVSDEFDGSKIQASYRDGVLELTLPKAEETKPRRIEVTA